MLTRLTQVLVKAETTNGTWNAPENTGGILAYEVVATPAFEMFKRDPMHSDLSRYQSLTGKQTASITFKTEVRGDGASVDPPDNIQVLLLACKMAVSGSTIIPKSTTDTTISIQVEEDGIHKQFKGCGGNVRLTGTAGEPMFFEFTFMGTIHDIAAGTLTTLSGIPTTVPPILISASFSTNVGSSQSHLINTIEFDLQNEVVMSPDINTSTGVKAAKIVGREPVGSFDPEYNTTYDWLDAIISNTQGTLSLTLGSSQYNNIRITCPQIRFLAMDPMDRDGIRALTVPFEMNRSSGNDEIVLDWSDLLTVNTYDSITIATEDTVGTPAP